MQTLQVSSRSLRRPRDKGPEEELFRDFVNTARSCNETDYYESLARLLYRWKVSAEPSKFM